VSREQGLGWLAVLVVVVAVLLIPWARRMSQRARVRLAIRRARRARGDEPR